MGPGLRHSWAGHCVLSQGWCFCLEAAEVDRKAGNEIQVRGIRLLGRSPGYNKFPLTGFTHPRWKLAVGCCLQVGLIFTFQLKLGLRMCKMIEQHPVKAQCVRHFQPAVEPLGRCQPRCLTGARQWHCWGDTGTVFVPPVTQILPGSHLQRPHRGRGTRGRMRGCYRGKAGGALEQIPALGAAHGSCVTSAVGSEGLSAFPPWISPISPPTSAFREWLRIKEKTQYAAEMHRSQSQWQILFIPLNFNIQDSFFAIQTCHGYGCVFIQLWTNFF